MLGIETKMRTLGECSLPNPGKLRVLSELSFSCSVTCIKVHVPSRTQQRAGTIRLRPVGTHVRGWCLLASVHSLRACVLGG